MRRTLLVYGITSIAVIGGAAFVSKTAYSNVKPAQETSTQKVQLSDTQVRKLAQAITVRVFSGEVAVKSGGSGVLIHRQGKVYTLITNEHVVSRNPRSLRVQTPDGAIHAAIRKAVTTSDDVAILQFRSPTKDYQVISLMSPFQLSIGAPVYASGFPLESNSQQSKTLEVTTGKISMVLKQPLVGGYQLGYTNDIKRGMSGGPVLNQQGEIIGINGTSKYPIFGDPFVFKDGSTVSDAVWQKMSQLSWAVPLQRFVKLTPKS